MSPIRRKIQRLLTLFIFGCIVLNYPLLALFSKNVLWFGIPSLFLYLFIIWAVFIIFIALVTERKKMPKTSFPLTYKKEG